MLICDIATEIEMSFIIINIFFVLFEYSEMWNLQRILPSLLLIIS